MKLILEYNIRKILHFLSAKIICSNLTTYSLFSYHFVILSFYRLKIYLHFFEFEKLFLKVSHVLNEYIYTYNFLVFLLECPMHTSNSIYFEKKIIIFLLESSHLLGSLCGGMVVPSTPLHSTSQKLKSFFILIHHYQYPTSYKVLSILFL